MVLRPFVVMPFRPYLARVLDCLSELSRGNKPREEAALSRIRKTAPPKCSIRPATITVSAMCVDVTVECDRCDRGGRFSLAITASPFGHTLVLSLMEVLLVLFWFSGANVYICMCGWSPQLHLTCLCIPPYRLLSGRAFT